MVAQEVAKEREVLSGQAERTNIQLEVSELLIMLVLVLVLVPALVLALVLVLVLELVLVLVGWPGGDVLVPVDDLFNKRMFHVSRIFLPPVQKKMKTKTPSLTGLR